MSKCLNNFQKLEKSTDEKIIYTSVDQEIKYSIIADNKQVILPTWFICSFSLFLINTIIIICYLLIKIRYKEQTGLLWKI